MLPVGAGARLRGFLPLRALVLSREELAEALELFGVGERDFDLAAAGRADDRHSGQQRALERLLERGQLGGMSTPAAGGLLGRGRGLNGANGVFGRAYRPVVGQDLVAEPERIGGAGQREERARVAHRQPAASEISLDLVGQTQKPQDIRNRGSVTADPLAELFLGPAELLEKLAIGFGLLHGVQILAQKVLNERELEALGVARLADDRRNPLEAGLASGTPAPLSGDQLI